jgi:hypothetical protein
MVLGVGLAGAILTTVMAHNPQPVGLFEAIHLSFFVAAGFALAGALISIIRSD